MNVQEYLSEFYKGTRKPTLDAMKFLMEKYHHPEKNLKFIHVAGTNGKGSCTEMMANILWNCGYRVGKFIGPHLIQYNERICINGQMISDEELENFIKELEPIMKEYEEIYHTAVTLFELLTTIAILYFARNHCDFAVLEVGLGGLYDCTNIVQPVVSIINSIGYDHIDILGSTLPEIAKQKAGIIKENSHTVFVEQEAEINQVIKEACNQKNNTLHLIKQTDIKNYTYNMEFQKFDYKNYEQIEINLKGEKQVYNASICLETVNILKQNYTMPEKGIREGLKTVIHKARFEKLQNNPTVIYDGAHNEPAITNLKKSVKMYYPNDKKVYIVSILNTKDYSAMLKKLITNTEDIYIFTSGNKPKYVPKEELYKEAKKIGINRNLYQYELKDALKIVQTQYKDYTIFAVGSFYVYGDVLKFLKENRDV